MNTIRDRIAEFRRLKIGHKIFKSFYIIFLIFRKIDLILINLIKLLLFVVFGFSVLTQPGSKKIHPKYNRISNRKCSKKYKLQFLLGSKDKNKSWIIAYFPARFVKEVNKNIKLKSQKNKI